MSHAEDSNILRHAPFRYLGYLNEVGESFRPIVPSKLVLSTYFISGGYVFADSLLIGWHSYKYDRKTEVDNERKWRFGKAFLQCFVWQIMATELIPGFSVYQIVKFAKRSKAISLMKNRSLALWLPTFIGLCFIPVFPFTIDPLVDQLFLKLGITLETSQIKL
jgi:fission process protein 1